MPDRSNTGGYSESDVGNLIKNKLENRGLGQIKCKINLANTRFSSSWSERFSGEPPLTQPEIDIIIKKDNKLDAIEIKYFRPTNNNNRFRNSYYEGIDQAIAYLRFGFDHVALWHVFNDVVPISQFRDWGWRSWNFLRELNLPIDFTYYKLNQETNSLRAVRTNQPGDGTLLRDLEEGPPELAWNYPNPYRNTDEGRKIRSTIEAIWDSLR